ncbi:AN1-type zinc finger protein 5-like [Grus japonensis]|uniref:AN1-type zinc finger protein 5-like n=1 Tax=Grus japonensis TaxID=30415 RepID=A0ABC9Y229_GRUJA
MSNGGSASGITYLRKGKKNKQTMKQQHFQPERGLRICERNNSADTKDREEEAGGDAPGARAAIPLQPIVKTMVRQAVPLQPMEVNGGADIHLKPVEDPMPQQVETPEGGCDPVGSLCWSRLLAGPVKREEQVCWQDL